jgi:hypothetical protein
VTETETQTVKGVKLSAAQTGMLLFFAGERDQPCGDPRTTGALITRELLARDAPSARYCLTELGRQVAARLAPMAADAAASR